MTDPASAARIAALTAETQTLRGELARARAQLEAFNELAGWYDGKELTREDVANELADFRFMIQQVPLVYDHVSGGQISKPNTYAHEVISSHDDRVTRDIEEAVAEALADLEPQQPARGEG